MTAIKKSDKELAFLEDLFVATDWGERFAELVDEHVPLPKKGRVLYLGSGTGGHAIALHERAGEKITMVCVDENEDSLELARAKATAVKEPAEFLSGTLDELAFGGNEFDTVIGNASLIPTGRLEKFISEMVRVAKPNGTVAIMLPTASSFGEFFSIYWEALVNAQLEDHGVDVENLITDLPTISDAENFAEEAGLENVTSWTAIEEFDFGSGEEFLKSPLITDFLLETWLQSVPDSARQRVVDELAQIIDEERHQGEFALSVKATLIAGTKARVQ